jgi:hypothetical protein
MTVLDEIVETCSKEIREEKDNIKQILLTLFSLFTKNPQNTRILAPSGEGKTYLVTKCAEYCPQENIIILAKATAQSFKYNLGSKKVVENGTGNWQDYDDAIKPLEEELSKTKDKEKQKELKDGIRELRDSVCDLVDFTNKAIILVDDQSYEFFETIKSTLSHDQEDLRSFSVNRTKSGTNKGQKFLSHGWPAVIYCSAKDEQKRDVTNEIGTRFNTISLNASSKKYREMLKLEGQRGSLPKFIYDDVIISEEEKEQTKQKILEIIERVKKSDEIINPYGESLSNLFPDDAGYRTRQLKVLNSNIEVITLANYDFVCKVIKDGDKIPISTRQDIEDACNLTKEQKEIQAYKIKYFNKHIKPAIKEHGKEKELVTGTTKCLTVSEIVDVLSKKKKPITADRQRLQETILAPCVEHGFLEKVPDPDNKSRDVYTVAERFLENDANVESTLVDTSTLDVSCVKSFVKKYLEQRFNSGELEILDENGKNITPTELVDNLCKIDAQTPKNRHKIGNNEASKSIEGEEK